MLGGLTTSNGAAFSPDGATFYHADTPTHAIRAYDVDAAAGTLSHGRSFHQFEHGNGRPDGGAVDAEGCYWSALWDGWRVVRFSPAGEDRKSVVSGKSVSVRVDLGGRRIIKKKTNYTLDMMI